MSTSDDRTPEEIVAELRTHLDELFEQSPDGVYIWLNESAKACNTRMAKLHGMTVAQWEAVPSFLEGFIAPDDRDTYGHNYQAHVADLQRPVRFAFSGLRNDGTTFAAETDMVPLTYGGHTVALHFTRSLGDD